MDVRLDVSVSLTLSLIHSPREECRLKVYENKVLRTVFEHKRDKVTGDMQMVRSFITCTLC
jgi:hypothetical protein